jgi:hypothetical protein
MPKITISFVKASFLRNVRELSLEGLSCLVYDLAKVLSLLSLRLLWIAPITYLQQDNRLTRLTFRPRLNDLLTLALPNAKILR